MLNRIVNLSRDERGASAVEYGLIVGLIAVALVAVLIVLGGDAGIKGLFCDVVEAIGASCEE